jgi:hypothetical protein
MPKSQDSCWNCDLAKRYPEDKRNRISRQLAL